MTINQFQGQTLNMSNIAVFLMASSMWHFSDPLHLREALLQVLSGIENV
jgi:hypothetical protein